MDLELKNMVIDKIMNFPYPLVEDEFIKPYLMYVIEHNEGNFNPYHNLKHELTMCEIAYKIAAEEEIKYEDVTLLMIAALFHDFNHTAEKETDDVNVKIAISEFIKAADLLWKDKKDNKFEKFKSDVINIIQATQYPYVIPNENLNILQQIIRDCDILVIIKQDFIGHTMGLAKEMNLNTMDFLKGERKFLEIQQDSMRTKSGKKYMKDNIDNIFRLIDKMLC